MASLGPNGIIGARSRSSEVCSLDKPLASLGVYLGCKLHLTSTSGGIFGIHTSKQWFIYYLSVGYCWISVVISGYRWLSHVIVHYQWLLLVVLGYCWLSVVIVGCTPPHPKIKGKWHGIYPIYPGKYGYFPGY